MKSPYPKRPSHFAHKFVRMLSRHAVSMELGADACWMLTIIAHQEDANHYERPAKWTNESLADRTGFPQSKMRRVRERCVKGGYLSYEPGVKGSSGVYWVIARNGLSNDDGPTENELVPAGGQESGHESSVKVPSSEQESGRNVGRNPAGIRQEKTAVQIQNGSHGNDLNQPAQVSPPVPVPVPKEAKGPQDDFSEDAPIVRRPKRGLQPSDFQDLDRGYEEFERVRMLGKIGPRHDQRFMTLWIGAQAADDPVRWFSAGLQKSIQTRQWWGTQEAEEQARVYLRLRNRAPPGPPSPEVAALAAKFSENGSTPYECC